MNVKTRNSLAWLALCLSILVTGWIIYDGIQRYQNLINSDQVFTLAPIIHDQQAKEALSLNKVIKAHLFGVQPVAVKKVEQPKVVNAPKTRLNLKLTGLVAASTPELGFAMIEIKRGETSVIGVGKDIGKTGAKLHAIETDHILIDHNGKIEKLVLERESLELNSEASLSTDTIKQLNLSEAELAALTQITQLELEQSQIDQLQNGQSASNDQQLFPDEALLQPEKVGEEVEQDPLITN